MTGKMSKEALDEAAKTTDEQLVFQLVQIKIKRKPYPYEGYGFTYKEIRDQRNDEFLSILYE